MKKVMVVLIIVGIALTLFSSSPAWAKKMIPFNVFINQNIIDVDMPVVYDDTVPYIPLRFVCEALNIPISWDPVLKGVFVDGKLLEEPYIFYGDQIYLTLERVEKVLGLKVGLDAENNFIALYSPKYEYKSPPHPWSGAPVKATVPAASEGQKSLPSPTQ